MAASSWRDQQILIGVVGQNMVGKTAWIRRATEDIFLADPPSEDPREQLDRHIRDPAGMKHLTLHDKRYRLLLWDAPVCKAFNTIVNMHKRFRMVDIILVVCSVTDERSFRGAIRDWQIAEYVSSKTIVLIGNKADLEERTVTYEQAITFAQKHHLTYIETSAKTGHNIELALISAINQLHNQCP